NRNFLMHGLTHDAFNSEDLGLLKPSRSNPLEMEYLHLTVDDIRSIADDIHTFDLFGFTLFMWAKARLRGGEFTISSGKVRPELPERPPLPEKLKLAAKPFSID